MQKACHTIMTIANNKFLPLTGSDTKEMTPSLYLFTYISKDERHMYNGNPQTNYPYNASCCDRFEISSHFPCYI